MTTSRAGGGLTTLTHGSAGPLTITEKLDATTNRTSTLTYNSAGKPATITDPRGKTTTLAYSTAGDLTSVTDPLTHSMGLTRFRRHLTKGGCDVEHEGAGG